MDTKLTFRSAGMPGAYDRRGAAHYLAISLSKIDELLRSGALKSRRVGRRVVIARVELDRFLEAA